MKKDRNIIMNRQECDILLALLKEPFINQRLLSETSGYSLGVVNRSLKNLIKTGYVDENMCLTDKARKEVWKRKPRRAVILAAGFGMRMVPINLEVPKALLEVKGEILIERQIRQLHEVGITEIYVVIGFMKERFEYLIDEYGVELVVNSDYIRKNNLYSLKLVLDHISDSYIIPCDIWCEKNPFRNYELYSWYMVNDLKDDASKIRVNRKMELVTVDQEIASGNTMVGIAYLTKEDALLVRENVWRMCEERRYDSEFWESALFDKNKMMIQARVVNARGVVEINTYEQLRELDCDSNHLKSDALETVGKALRVPVESITGISVLKKGMTNRSFFFKVNKKKYIMRVPGEGTEQLINRKQEAVVYQAIAGRGLCDDPIYINPNNGYKITEYLEGVKNCDPDNVEELKLCMWKLKEFHDMHIKVDHEFRIFDQIDFYESLWNGKESIYRDYKKTKAQVLSLRPYVEKHCEEKWLTHIDAVPDNFLFYERNGKKELQLTDWEYAGMQDPHLDIAMFCIYSLYNRHQVERLIDIYFENQCDDETRIKIYCYIAICGLLWSNWCEYKSMLGIEFGEYSLRQYRYAKDYYWYARKQMKKEELDV